MNVSEVVQVRPSVCPLDCPDTCSLSVTTDGVRLLDVRGSKANPYTAGVICNKVARPTRSSCTVPGALRIR